MRRVRRLRDEADAVSPVIATILMVAITVVLAAVLYVMVSVIIVPPDDFRTITVTVTQRGANWSVEVVATPAGRLLTTTFLLIRGTDGTLALARTPWSALTAANWGTYKAAYQDANPGVAEIRSGDSVLVDVQTYPAGSSVEVLDEDGVLARADL